MDLAFFGAFNPPTVAHLSLAQFALEKTGARQVIFVPSRAAYIREDQGKDFAYTDRQRLAMLNAAAECRSWMRVYDGEIRQENQPRTYTTLCAMREQGITASLLMGSDKLPELEKGWLHVKEIAEEFGIVVLSRGSDECGQMIREDPYLNGLAPYIRVLETPGETRNVSSTAVRQQVRQIRELWDKLAGMVPAEILDMVIRAEE